MSNAIAVRDKKQAIQRLTSGLAEIVNIRSEWLDDKRAELARAIEAYKALAGAGAGKTKQRYAQNRVTVLRKIVNCLEAGFVPIPSFDANRVNVNIQSLPLAALVAVNDATASGLFDEVRFVAGREGSSHGASGRRMSARDPLLVGVVYAPKQDVVIETSPGWIRTAHLPAIEQHFLLAWWKPSDEVDADLW